MTNFIPTHSPLPVLTPEDRTYIHANFYTLEELCLGRTGSATEYRSQIRAGLLPRPTYVVDGTEIYPADFFLFPDSVGSLGAALRDEFVARYLKTAKAYGETPIEVDLAKEYSEYLTGEYAVCLRLVLPETIFLKGLAISEIEELLATPDLNDPDWSANLKTWVGRLDGLEREFAPCDTERFGSVSSRVRFIQNVKAAYPSCFLPT